METQTGASDKARNEMLVRRKLIAQIASVLSVAAAAATMVFSINTFFKQPKKISPPTTEEIVIFHDLSRSIEQEWKIMGDVVEK